MSVARPGRREEGIAQPALGCQTGADLTVARLDAAKARTMNVSRIAASAVFLSSGTLHFLKPAIFVEIVPPALPFPGALVALSGAAELAGALGLQLPRTRRAAAAGLIALLVAVFPANVYMFVAHERFAALAPSWVLLARLPLQALLIAWVWACRK